MKITYKIIIALIICVIGFFAIRWFLIKPEELLLKKEAVPVEAVVVESGSITRSLTAVGTLKAIQSVTIRSEVEGKIAKIFFKEGQEVKKDNPLYKLNDAIYRAKVMQAQAQVSLQREEHNRALTLLKKGFGTPQQRDKTLAELQASKAQLVLAKVDLANTLIKAPFEGTMGFSNVSIGAVASPSVELVNIVDLDPINIDFSIPESFLGKIKVEQNVDVIIEDFDILPIEAKIIAINPEIDILTRTVMIRASMSNKQNSYRPGEFARVIIEAGKIDNAVLIPETAIEKRGEEEYVFLVVDGVAVESVVSTGMKDGNRVEITDGVKSGDTVISAGQFKVRDGEEVTIVSNEEK